MEKHLIIRRLQRIYATLNSLDIDYLLRKEVLGSNSLIHLKSIVIDLVEKCESFIKNADNISSITLREASDFFLRITENFEAYNNLSDVDYIAQRETIETAISIFKDELDNLWEKVAGVVKLKTYDSDFEKQIQDIESSKSEIDSNRDEIKETLKDIENLKRSVSAQLDEWKERYTKENINIELITQGNSFNTRARANEKNSFLWIIAIAISTLVLVILISCFMCTVIEEISILKTKTYIDYKNVCATCSEKVLWLYFAKGIVLKALLISINIYIIRFCVKNYNACMHNQTVNDQRQASFDVAFHFYNTIVSDRKDEILIMAANSIFTHQKTGYIEKESEPNNPAIIEKIIDKVQNIALKTNKK